MEFIGPAAVRDGESVRRQIHTARMEDHEDIPAPATQALSHESLSANSESVDELGPENTGRWLVRSRGSEHIFDLDAGTYIRHPGAGHGQFRNDGHAVRLTRVERWPKIGEPFFIWVDDHEHPAVLEHWHQSSSIISITSLVSHASG